MLVSAGGLLASFSPPAIFSSSLLSALDPDQGGVLCGPRQMARPLSRHILVASAAAATPISRYKAMPLFKDLTGSRFPASTRNILARRYMSQGLLLTYGFNHTGAVRSFREAQRLDPECAACWWGEAVALGPNINAPMDERDRGAALNAVDRAMSLRDRATPLERALIEAVALRYSRDAQSDRAALDRAYADAMLAVARRFPLDDDVAVLAAEAVMDTSPWNYWESDKLTPVGRIGDAVALVEAVLSRNPDHPQAAHLYIHLMEASDPRRAEAAADRLTRTRPATAGHLVHMPGHIYYGRGRYADAIKVNVAAARADEAYLRKTDDHSLVRYGYYPHNVHFIVTSAQMAGDMRTAIRESRRLRTILDPATSARIAWIQAIDAAPYLAMAQFARAQDILALPTADPRLPYAVGMRHYARAIAHAQNKDRTSFEAELAAIVALKRSGRLATMVEQGVPALDLLSLAEAVARGRFAVHEGRYDHAIVRFRDAALIESRLPYNEPPYWSYPVQQSLGAALFLAGRFEEANQAFRATLVRAPHNGWALYGLSRSEAAAGHRAEAAAAHRSFAKTWIGDRSWLSMERL
ncbi:conserved hypothetical protein [Novosphingobium sp. 9U]|nr:hypothetical protein [Novosphingobium sp. 9U]VWX54440.1 conserved hypothetical protein [Novosphingobium sp. 9U]